MYKRQAYFITVTLLRLIRMFKKRGKRLENLARAGLGALCLIILLNVSAFEMLNGLNGLTSRYFVEDGSETQEQEAGPRLPGGQNSRLPQIGDQN